LELGCLRLGRGIRSPRLAHSYLDNRKVQAMTFHQSGEIEIDLHRGVVYFHSATGITLLRICGLDFPKDFDPQTGQMDISIRQPVSYTRQL
jgi:hypothetical protein